MAESRKEYQKEYRESHKDKAREYLREWQRKNKDKTSGYMKTYRERHPEVIARIQKKYYESHKEQHREAARKYARKYYARKQAEKAQVKLEDVEDYVKTLKDGGLYPKNNSQLYKLMQLERKKGCEDFSKTDRRRAKVVYRKSKESLDCGSERLQKEGTGANLRGENGIETGTRETENAELLELQDRWIKNKDTLAISEMYTRLNKIASKIVTRVASVSKIKIAIDEREEVASDAAENVIIKYLEGDGFCVKSNFVSVVYFAVLKLVFSKRFIKKNVDYVGSFENIEKLNCRIIEKSNAASSWAIIMGDADEKIRT